MSSRRHAMSSARARRARRVRPSQRPTHQGESSASFLQLPGVRRSRVIGAIATTIDGSSSWRSRRCYPANAALSAEKSRQTKTATSLVKARAKSRDGEPMNYQAACRGSLCAVGRADSLDVLRRTHDPGAPRPTRPCLVYINTTSGSPFDGADCRHHARHVPRTPRRRRRSAGAAASWRDGRLCTVSAYASYRTGEQSRGKIREAAGRRATGQLHLQIVGGAGR